MLAALSEERIFYIPKSRREEFRRRAFSFVLVALIYGGIAVAIYYQPAPVVTQQEQEIPVEVVVEPPPPPPPPPKAPEPEAKQAAEPPKPQDIDMTPAHDAPKQGTAATDNGDKEKDAKPPPAPEQPDKTAERLSGAEAQAQAPKPEATPEPTPDPTPTPVATPEPTPTETPPPPLKAADDGEMPAPAAAPTPAPQPVATAAPAPVKPQPPAGKGKDAPLFAALPDVEFGGAAIKVPVAGGAARGNYLSIVYGMIMPRVRKPLDAHAIVGRGHGVVVFSIDGQGRLVDRWISEQSGSPELDKAVFNAIGAAGPFPPPPTRGTVQLRFTYDGG